jgi:predicted DCC family thiol-disulfide oxidoreductase YuxK
LSTHKRFNSAFCLIVIVMQSNARPDFNFPSARTDSALTVYYDGACPVCSREIAVYRRQVGAEQCVWVDASICDESALGEGLSRGSALARFHVRRANGELVDGMRGFTILWRALPRLAWAARIASIGPLPLLLDAAYRVFLWVRPLWQGARTASTSKQQP